MAVQTELFQIENWVMRIRVPEGTPPFPVVLLLHGFTGDETSMWVFAPRLPVKALLIALRGIFPTPLGGYSWVNQKIHKYPSLREFDTAIHSLDSLLKPINFPDGDLSNIRMVGFSQGAAFMFGYALRYPERISALAGLSGFVPEDSGSVIHTRPLAGKKVFLAHGTRDELVPIERARASATQLDEAGAEVSYCEYEMGHKLGAACFKSMGEWFKQTEVA